MRPSTVTTLQVPGTTSSRRAPWTHMEPGGRFADGLLPAAGAPRDAGGFGGAGAGPAFFGGGAAAFGGAGRDMVYGGAGNDFFNFVYNQVTPTDEGNGNDTIGGFDADGNDIVQLPSTADVADFDDLVITQAGNNVSVDTKMGTILFYNLTTADLTAEDFDFY